MGGWEPRGKGSLCSQSARCLSDRCGVCCAWSPRGLEGEPGVELGTGVRPGARLHAERLGVSIRILLDGQATGGEEVEEAASGRWEPQQVR